MTVDPRVSQEDQELARRFLEELGRTGAGGAPMRITPEPVAPGTNHPAWYGRWKIETPPCLIELVTVRLQWTDDLHAFELDLQNGGYPLTSVRLAAHGGLDDGDASAAAESRATILPVLERVPGCLGLARGEFDWSNGGDYGPLYPQDAAEIRNVWVPRLNAAAP